jgi:hypothetical protein
MQRKNGTRTFLKWWNSIPIELKEEAKNICNNNYNDIIMNINYILLKINLSQMNCIKPTIEELEYWLSTGQIKNSNCMKRKLITKLNTIK